MQGLASRKMIELYAFTRATSPAKRRPSAASCNRFRGIVSYNSNTDRNEKNEIKTLKH